MGPSCSGSQSERRIRLILPFRGVLVTQYICSDDTKNSENIAGRESYFPYILLNEIQTMFSQLAKRSARVLPADLCTDHAHYVKIHRSTVLSTLIPSVFVPLDQRSGNSSRQASMRSKRRRLEVRDCGLEKKQETWRSKAGLFLTIIFW